MESTDLNSGIRILSRSPLHSFITGPSSAGPRVQSSFNPYRKKLGILAFLGLEEAEEPVESESADLAKSRLSLEAADGGGDQIGGGQDLDRR